MCDFELNFSHKQLNKYHQKVCGDAIAFKRLEKEDRIVIVLSDGLGSGIKANVLSTMASSMICKYVIDEKNLKKVAETVLKYLPECSERKLKYATFTIIDVTAKKYLKLIEYGNPFALYYRNNKSLELNREKIEIMTSTYDKNVYYTELVVEKNDMLIAFSDGISQAGTGKDIYPRGWGEKYIKEYIDGLFIKNNEFDANFINQNIVSMANYLDNYKNEDDVSAVTMFFRESKKLLIATGAPQNRDDDKKMSDYFWSNDYSKIICGGTTTKILLREIGEDENKIYKENYIPEVAENKGLKLVSEGVITLSSILDDFLEEKKSSDTNIKRIMEAIKKSDEIIFLVGLKLNQANIVKENRIDIRQNIVGKISNILKHKFLKKTSIIYY